MFYTLQIHINRLTKHRNHICGEWTTPTQPRRPTRGECRWPTRGECGFIIGQQSSNQMNINNDCISAARSTFCNNHQVSQGSQSRVQPVAVNATNLTKVANQWWVNTTNLTNNQQLHAPHTFLVCCSCTQCPSIEKGCHSKEGKGKKKMKSSTNARVGALCALYHFNYESSYLFLLYILYAFYHSEQGWQQTRGQRNEEGISKSERYQQWIMLMWWWWWGGGLVSKWIMCGSIGI